MLLIYLYYYEIFPKESSKSPFHLWAITTKVVVFDTQRVFKLITHI